MGLQSFVQDCIFCSIILESMLSENFAKSRAMCVSVVYVPTCQKRANFSFLHANVLKAVF